MDTKSTTLDHLNYGIEKLEAIESRTLNTTFRQNKESRIVADFELETSALTRGFPTKFLTHIWSSVRIRLLVSLYITRWPCIYPRSRSGLITPGRGQFLWIWEKFGQRRSSGKVRYRYRSLYIGASICTFRRVYFGQPRTLLDLLWAIHDFGDRRPWMTIQGHFKSSEQSFPARHLISGFDSSINPCTSG